MSAKKPKVMVWIRCENEFLVLKTKPERGSFWQPVTGSVEEGEEIDQAAARELKEETGLLALRLLNMGSSFEFESRGKKVEEYPFIAEVASGSRKKVKLDPKEHVEFEWVSGEEAIRRVKYESNSKILKNYLDYEES